MLALVLRRGGHMARAGVWGCGSRLLSDGQGVSLTETSRSIPALVKRDYKAIRVSAAFSYPRSVRSASAWEKVVCPAFRTFLELNKHMLVPEKFVVRHGDEAWPRETWGYQLGKHTKWLRTQKSKSKGVPEFAKDDLEELGFPWTVSKYKWDYFVMPSLRRFYDLHGHTDVWVTFIVPVGDAEWPERLWGQHLGRIVYNIRSQKTFKKQVDASSKELDAMEFCYRTSIYERDWSQRILPSLQVFRRAFGHCDVGQSFVVPSAEPWPEKAWGLQLGWSVMGLRFNGTYVEQAARDKVILEELNFVWNHLEAEWSERILPALQVFHRSHEHSRVPQRFAVPSEPPWPENTWGLSLGMIVSQMRLRGTYAKQVQRDKEFLEELGILW